MSKKSTVAPVEIFTDGACSGNPGPGGWGAILRSGEHEKEIFGGERMTTNNRMELMAAIKALDALKKPSTVMLYTDSRYVMDGLTKWLPRWKAERLEDGRQEAGEEWRSMARSRRSRVAPRCGVALGPRS